MITWKDLKDNIRELGFDDETAIEEAIDRVIISSNRAINIILDTFVRRFERYFIELLSTDDKKWEIPKIEPITRDTKDVFVIDLPDRVNVLIPLLASHYVWLDDDERKAVYYWNEYEGFRDELSTVISMPRKLIFKGGVDFD